MTTKDDYYTPENEDVASRTEHASPSGTYVLTTSRYATKPGCWNYSRGIVRRVATGEVVADIKRNYSAFPFLWVEDHPNGHPYFIAGENYQGQSVVELDTGRRRDQLPDAAKKGHGFCWAEYRFDATARVLVVDGCIWACPYEFRIYDFADPMEGWGELETDHPVWNDPRWPTFEADGTIKTYETAPEPDDVEYDDDDEEPDPLTRPIAAIATYRRDGAKLTRVNEWVSEEEAARRKSNEEARKRYEAELAEFRANDPLYRAYREHLKKPVFKSESNDWSGVTYEGWCPDFTGRERRWGRRIHEVRNEKGHADKSPGWVTVDLEWATQTGPVKVQVYRDGAVSETTFFPHSIEGMDQAFACAEAAILSKINPLDLRYR